MTDRPFLTTGQRDFITKQRRRAQATKLVLQDGGVTLVLSRWSEAQNKYVALPAQQVTLTFDRTQIQGTSSDAATARRMTGTLTKEVPFDVEAGDLFSYGPAGDEQQAKVDAVLPARLGTQSAKFSLVIGEQ